MPYFGLHDGCRIFYETGKGDADRPVLILLNGTAQTTVNWKPVADRLESRFHVIRYDARAQGRSDAGNLRLCPRQHVDDLMALLDFIGVNRVFTVGMSHGACIARLATHHFPERISGMILCGAGAEQSIRAERFIALWREILENSGIEAMCRAFLPVVFGERFLRENRQSLDKMIHALVVRNKPESLKAHLAAMANYPPLGQIGSTTPVPCLVISGTDDILVSPENARKLAHLYNGKYEEIPDAGHSVPAENPERFVQLVLDFIK